MDIKDRRYFFVFNCGSHEGLKGHGNGRKNMRWEEKIFLKLLHSLSIRLLFANERKVSWGNAKLFAKKC